MAPLDDSWAKLDRAKEHADCIRRRLVAALGSDEPVPIPLKRKYESATRSVVYRIESVPEVPPRLGLIVGDAIHDFRSALDYAWWQLASKHLGREPDKAEAPNIQFPILSDTSFRGNTEKWENHRFLRHVNRADVARIEPVQPYNRIDPAERPALEVLADLSNTDKHRTVNAVLAGAFEGVIRVPCPEKFTDCLNDLRPSGSNGEMATMVLYGDGMSDLHPEYKVVEAFVRPLGPNPDVDLEATLTGVVVIGGNLRLLDTLDAIGAQVTNIIEGLEPIF